MKIKITCRPRYNPWLRKYLNTKTFSKILALGVLINSVPINSFAEMLSEDGRYETFEGSSIKIDDILEEDKVDVKIEGNTLVNKLGWVTKKNNNSTIVDDTKKTISFNKPATEFNYHVTFENATVEVDKTYTLVFNILKNTLENTSGHSSLGRFNILSYNKGNHPINFGETGLVKVVLSQPSTSSNIKPFLEIYKECEGELIIEKPYLLEGDWTNKELPDYFENIKSVGQDNTNSSKIEILSQNKNLITEIEKYSLNIYGVDASFEDDIIVLNGVSNTRTDYNYTPYSYEIPLRKNTTYTLRFHEVSGSCSLKHFAYKLIKYNGEVLWKSADNGVAIINTGTDIEKISRIRLHASREGVVFDNWKVKIQLEENSEPTSYTKHLLNKKEILINEPLRGLPNGVKDRIIKRNNQWYIERNIEQIVLNGDENWFIDTDRNNSSTNYFRTFDFREGKDFNAEYNYKTDFFLNDKYIQNTASKNWSLVDSEKPNLDVNRSKAISIREGKLALDEFKNKLKNNPVTIVCQLINPYYEQLNIGSALNLYEGTTYISTSSTIPATMEVTVDRTINRAVEYTELAKTNPTIENLSKARYWNNLLKDSITKEQLQEKIDSITNISDMVLDRKTATSNLDVYIKSENILQMSLDTNQISFEDFSGIEDVEKINAVNLTINSSLPYQINAYLPVEIQNADKTKTLDKSILNIKESSSSNYQTFTNTTDKIILKDNCSAGNQLTHGVDLKLAGGIAHEKDVYKAIIKLEAEQK